jgi:hypothetical protein
VISPAAALAAALLAGSALFLVAAAISRRGFGSLPTLAPLVAAVGAMAGGATSLAAPTGHETIDAVERSLLIFAVAMLARTASPRVLLALALTAAVLGAGAPASIAAAAGAGLLAGLDPPARWARTAAGVGICIAALGLPSRLGPAGWPVAGILLVTTAAAGFIALEQPVRRRVLLGAVAGVIVVGVAGAFAALQLRSVASEARAGQRDAQTGLRLLGQADSKGAVPHLEAARRRLGKARAATGSTAAAPLRFIPVAAQHLEVADRLVVAADGLTADALAIAGAGELGGLVPKHGQVDLAAIERLQQPVASASRKVIRARLSIQASRSSYLLPQATRLLDDADATLLEARDRLEGLSLGLNAAPGLLGANGTRRAFVGFTTPSEIRGSQGVLGSFAEIETTNGHITLTNVGRDSDLNSRGVPLEKRTLAGPKDYVETWGRYQPERNWQNVTLSPDFPAVGQAIAALYPQSGGRPVDLVILLDPAGVSSLLRLSGPVRVAGWPEPVTAANAVKILGIDQYSRFPDNDKRVAFLSDLTKTAFQQLLATDSGQLAPAISCLGNAAKDQHFLLWSARPAEAFLFDRIGMDGSLRVGAGDDIAAVAFNNAGANKLDWFLDHKEKVTYSVDDSGQRLATVSITLDNNAPKTGYPAYVLGGGSAKQPLPPGDTTMLVSVYAAGRPATALIGPLAAKPALGKESGFDVSTVQATLASGASTTVRISFKVKAKADDAPAPTRPRVPGPLRDFRCG